MDYTIVYILYSAHPDIKLDIFVCDGLDVEPHRGYGGDRLT